MKLTKIDENSCKLTLGKQEISRIMVPLSKVNKLSDELQALMDKENIPFL